MIITLGTIMRLYIKVAFQVYSDVYSSIMSMLHKCLGFHSTKWKIWYLNLDMPVCTLYAYISNSI